MSAILGMATKYAENLLGVKYRTKDEKGEMCGGPMYYIEKGMGEKWIWLAIQELGQSLLVGLLQVLV